MNTRNIIIFTDLETDDIIAIKLLKPFAKKLILVVGEGTDMWLKTTIADQMKICDHVLTGLGSDKEYPDDGNESLLDITSYGRLSADPFDLQRITNAVKESDLCFCIKPPREFMMMPANTHFPNTEFWFTGSFNLRSVWPKDSANGSSKDEVVHKLMDLFNKRKVVWVESFTAIGERNSITTSEFKLKDEFTKIILRNWNNFMIKDAADDVIKYTKILREKLEHDSPIYDVVSKLVQGQGQTIIDKEWAKELLCILGLEMDEYKGTFLDKEINKLYRNLKCYLNIVDDPNQFLLADQLLPVIFCSNTSFDSTLSPVKFEGYQNSSYPVFSECVGSRLFISNKNKEKLREHAIIMMGQYV